MKKPFNYLAEVESAILSGTWENTPEGLRSQQAILETWSTKANGWTVNVVLNREKDHQDVGAASTTQPLVMHLTPELVRLAVEQIDKVVKTK